jgi:hypothetical protein
MEGCAKLYKNAEIRKFAELRVACKQLKDMVNNSDCEDVRLESTIQSLVWLFIFHNPTRVADTHRILVLSTHNFDPIISIPNVLCWILLNAQAGPWRL